MNNVDRFSAYLGKCPGAIAGQGGSAATFSVCCRAVEFGLSFDEALPPIMGWSVAKCQPPWTENELRHKLSDAFKRTQPKPQFTCPRRNTFAPPTARKAICDSAPQAVTPSASSAPTIPAVNQKPDVARLRLVPGEPWQFGIVSAQRHLSPQAVALASERGLLRFGWHRGVACWLILDRTLRNIVARRMDGQMFETAHGPRKAVMVKHSRGMWPIGVQESAPYPVVMLVEGQPDFIAGFHFMLIEGRVQDCAVVAMAIGSPPIPADALGFFARKRVRIFGHNDDSGGDAVARWTPQLLSVGAYVDSFRFDGVKDLNDFARVHARTVSNAKVIP